jgi:hypothetical protein
MSFTMKLLVTQVCFLAYFGEAWKVANRDRHFEVHAGKRAPACRAGKISRMSWNCNDAELKTLAPAVPCHSTEPTGEVITTCVDNIDTCAQLAAEDPECRRQIRYHGNETGPAGDYAGLCGCIKKDLECSGWPEADSNVASVICEQTSGLLQSGQPVHWEDISYNSAGDGFKIQKEVQLSKAATATVAQSNEESIVATSKFAQLQQEFEALKDKYEQTQNENGVLRQAVEDYTEALRNVADSQGNKINGTLGLAVSTSHSHLLAFRASCSNCLCLVQDAVQCGTDTVESAAKCGSSYITSGAKCGFDYITDALKCGVDLFKSCRWSRRRSPVGALHCNWGSVAKKCNVARSCNFPNTCQWPRSCNLAKSFGECLTDITNAVNDASTQPYMKFLVDTGCTSPSACKTEIEQGLLGAKDLIQKVMEPQLGALIKQIQGGATSAIGDISKYGQIIQSEGTKIISEAKTHVTSAINTFKGFFESLPPFQKYSLGDGCTAPGVGFWYMTGDDCGAFDAMGKIFTDIINAPTHFNSATSGLKTCLSKRGLLNFPTPFMTLKVQQFCLPKFVLTSLEYLLGAIMYAGNLAKELVDSLQSIKTTLTNFVSSKLGLLQIGHTLARAGEHSNVSVTGTKCEGKPNWGLDFFLRGTVNLKISGGFSYGFSMGFGVGIGCVDGNLVNPNFVMQLGISPGWANGEINGGAEGGIEIGLTYNQQFISYKEQKLSSGGYLTITPSINVPWGAGYVSANLPISLQLLPDPNIPTGFSFVLRGSLESGALMQLGKMTSKAASDAVEEVSESDASTQTLAAITAFSNRLAAPQGLESALAKEHPDKDQVLKQASFIQENQEQLTEEAKRALPPLGIAVTADICYYICLNPGSCS